MKLNNPFTIQLIILAGILLLLVTMHQPQGGIIPLLIFVAILFLIIKTSSTVKRTLLKVLHSMERFEITMTEKRLARAKKRLTWIDEKIAADERKLEK